MDRKEFIRTSGRWIILGGLAVFTGGLLLKNRISTNKNTCGNSKSLCRDCTSLSSCALPEAINFRNDEKNKGI